HPDLVSGPIRPPSTTATRPGSTRRRTSRLAPKLEVPAAIVGEVGSPFFTVHDYGMGGTWQYVVAGSAASIRQAFPQPGVHPELPSWADDHADRTEVHRLDDRDDPFIRELAEERESWGELYGVRGEWIRVEWRHDSPDDPVVLYSELDAERWETRKVDVYADG